MTRPLLATYPRPFARLRAWWQGYFYLPCPNCGRMTTGQEWRDRNGKPSHIYLHPDQPTLGTGICPPCTRAGVGTNYLYFACRQQLEASE